jgi:hypothetical protein
MSTLEKELQESIKKNLPQQVGETLKLRLDQADADAKQVQSLEKLSLQLSKDLTEAHVKIEEYKLLDKRNSELDSRQKSLEKEERNLQLQRLTYELQAEKDKTEFTKSVALGLVRNLEYRKNTFDNENQAGYNGVNGQWIQPTTINKNLNTTDTIG